MRAFVLALACLVVAPAALAAAPLQRSASVLTSSTIHGAKPVALTVTLTYEMQCGNPGRTPLTLTLPAAMTVPASISTNNVLLDGKPAKSVAVHGSRLVIAIEQPHFLTCDVIGLSSLKILITKKAGLGNPKTAGIYGFPIEIGPIRGTPKLQIT
jgi:hypothetical protein